MKLLLDEMYPPQLARELGRRGHDVAAVGARPELRAMDDEPLLMAAAAEERVLVTENVVDFPEIAAALATDEQAHCGIILVSSRAFPRTERGFGLLMRALDTYLGQHATERTISGGIHWLSSAPR